MNGAVGNYNAHLAAYPGVDWERFARRFVEGLGPRVQPLHDADRAARLRSPSCSTPTRARTRILLDLDRDLWGYISLGYFRQKREGGRSRLLHHAAQGEPDRLRELGRQPRHRQRAAAPSLRRSCRCRAGSAIFPTRPRCATSASRSANAARVRLPACAAWPSSRPTRSRLAERPRRRTGEVARRGGAAGDAPPRRSGRLRVSSRRGRAASPARRLSRSRGPSASRADPTRRRKERPARADAGRPMTGTRSCAELAGVLMRRSHFLAAFASAGARRRRSSALRRVARCDAVVLHC